jgi:hypothetical protein
MLEDSKAYLAYYMRKSQREDDEEMFNLIKDNEHLIALLKKDIQNQEGDTCEFVIDRLKRNKILLNKVLVYREMKNKLKIDL